MKKFFSIFTFAAAAVLMAVSCMTEKESAPGAAKVTPSFRASIELPAPETRVYADDDLNLRWNEGDLIGVFDHLTYRQKYEYVGEDGAYEGSFNLVPEEGFITGADMPYTCAIYPYEDVFSFQNFDGQLYIYLPSEQVYREGSFGPGANNMVAVTDNGDLLFKNVCGFLMFKLYGDNLAVTSLSLRANGGERISGNVYVNAVPGEDPTIAEWVSGNPIITLNCTKPVRLGSSADDYTEFWFAVPPVTMSSGFTLTVDLADGRSFTQEYNGSLEITRNHRTRMAPLKVDMPGLDYVLNPKTGEPAIVHWTQSWWEETVDTYIRYYERVPGVRVCFTETITDSHAYNGGANVYDGYGFFGAAEEGEGEWTFVWYTEDTDSAGRQYIELPMQNTGYYVSNYGSYLYVYDAYAVDVYLNNYYRGSWLVCVSSGMYPDQYSYYDGNGGFYLYTGKYYMPDVGGWQIGYHDNVGIAEGFDRQD
ncbi:MAG: hypothetical protein J5533_02055 [Bacteroidales bacterium]|nr:hypothetical protein [Bacteroidales bacterium]